MFFIDALRHAGRAQLASFAGGSAGNVEMDQSVCADTPYRNDAGAPGPVRPRRRGLRRRRRPGRRGRQQLRRRDQRADRRDPHQPAADAGRVRAARPSRRARRLEGHRRDLDRLAGRRDLRQGRRQRGRLGARARGGAQALRRAGRASASGRTSAVPTTPRPPTTVHDTHFPYMPRPRKGAKAARCPTRGPPSSPRRRRLVHRSGEASSERRRQPPRHRRPARRAASMQGASNALLVSKNESKGGAPVAVFGPQVSYYTPQILMEQELHAPGGPTGPPLDARGTAFPGTNLYVQLGHGRDYAWSATSAGQDITDTFAVPLCNADGSKPTLDSTSYRFRGSCQPIDVLERDELLDASRRATRPRPARRRCAPERTKLGIVTHRAARSTASRSPTPSCARPTTTRSTRRSASPTSTTPRRWSRRRSSMKAACRIHYTFNWFYIDAEHIAYFNSGINPVRAARADPDLPTPGTRKFEWQGFVAAVRRAALRRADRPDQRRSADQPLGRRSLRAHPQVVDQRYLTSWNNKQAPGFRAPTTTSRCGPVFRSQMLDDRIAAADPRQEARSPARSSSTRWRTRARSTCAATSPFRYALELIGGAGRRRGPAARSRRCAPGCKSGSHRRDKNARRRLRPGRGGADHGRLVAALARRPSSSPTLGGEAVRRARGRGRPPRRPRPDRLGVHHRLVRLRQQGPADDPRRRRARPVLAHRTAAAARWRSAARPWSAR